MCIIWGITLWGNWGSFNWMKIVNFARKLRRLNRWILSSLFRCLMEIIALFWSISKGMFTLREGFRLIIVVKMRSRRRNNNNKIMKCFSR